MHYGGSSPPTIVPGLQPGNENNEIILGRGVQVCLTSQTSRIERIAQPIAEQVKS